MSVGKMGMKKHGKSGWKNGSGKSPRLRLAMKMDAEQNERKARKYEMFSNVRDAFTAYGQKGE